MTATLTATRPETQRNGPDCEPDTTPLLPLSRRRIRYGTERDRTERLNSVGCGFEPHGAHNVAGQALVGDSLLTATVTATPLTLLSPSALDLVAGAVRVKANLTRVDLTRVDVT